MTLVVLGPKWLEAAPYMGALALIGALQALNSCYWPMLLTRLGPRTVFKLAALGVAVTIPVFGFVLWFAGLMPAIAAWIFSGVLMLFVGARWLLNDLGGSMKPLLRAILRPALGSAAMAIALVSLQPTLSMRSDWFVGAFNLLILIAVGAVIYIVTVVAMWIGVGRPHEAEEELWFLLKSRLSKAA
jgi:O-antigen/teichoic acid export membrane protein